MTEEFINVGSYQIEPLKAQNWMPWKRCMLAIFRDLGLEKYIEPNTEPLESDDEKKKWKEGDAKTRAHIELAISDAEMVHIMGAVTARQMLENLTTVKESKGRLGILAAC